MMKRIKINLPKQNSSHNVKFHPVALFGLRGSVNIFSRHPLNCMRTLAATLTCPPFTLDAGI